MDILKMNDKTFEIVNELPYGYKIWNIGRENFKFEKYIPLCQTYNGCSVNVNTLKAFKVSSDEFYRAYKSMNWAKPLNYVDFCEAYICVIKAIKELSEVK